MVFFREKMPLTTGNQLTIEKSPAYFHSKTAAEANSSVESCDEDHSCRKGSSHESDLRLHAGVIKAKSFRDDAFVRRYGCGRLRAVASKQTVPRKSAGSMSDGEPFVLDFIITHMKRWLDNFPMEQIHIVDGERLVTQPALEVSQTEKFLGLQPVVKPEHFGIDPVKKFPCVRRPDGSLHCLGKTKGRKHPHVRSDVLQRLRRFYAPENQKFFRMINRSLAW
ncbi:hypothetical protein COOONC_07817 [Cooperia oncophora]